MKAHTWQSPFQLMVLTLLAFLLCVLFGGASSLGSIIIIIILIIIIITHTVLLTVWSTLLGSRQEPGSDQWPPYFCLIVVTFYPHLVLPFLRKPRAWGNLPVRGSREIMAASCHYI